MRNNGLHGIFRRRPPRLFALCAALSLLPPVFAERIVFSADSMSGTVGDKSDVTQLKGEAYVLTETMEISADSIKMSGTDFRYIEADGSVVGKNLESHLEFSCGSLRYDRETKIAGLQDDVTLTDIENNVAAKAQMIEYNQTQDIAVMQIDIELKQKDNVCTGAYAVYRKAEQLLELSGNAQIKQGGDTFRAQEITLDLDSQEITLDGRVKGSIVDERKGASEEGASEDAGTDGGDSSEPQEESDSGGADAPAA
ncbi:MAG: organic solvent tolerance protein OstA, partial [Treponemataceae bacterium]|nr:organic solvent tolerance protein OstA [Treponemataceae bacterium]